MAATVTRIGSQTYAEISPEYFRGADGAWFTTRRWRGLRADLLDIADSVGGEASLTEEAFPWFILSVRFQGLQTGATPPPPNAQVTTLYTLDAPQRIDPIWQLPEVRAEFEKIRDLDARAALKSDLEALARGERFTSSVDASGAATNVAITIESVLAAALAASSPRINATVIRTLFGELSRGVDSFIWDDVVITKQTVAPNASSVRATYNRRNRVLKTATLLRYCPDMPAIMSANIRSQLATGFWRVSSPRIEQVDNATSRLTETFSYSDIYSTAIYGAAL